MRFVTAVSVGLLLACGGGPAPQPETSPETRAATESRPRVPDRRTWFPLDGRTSFEVVEDQVMGKDWLPAGNVGRYEVDGKSYTLFLVPTSSADAAALLAFEAKGKLTDAKFVPSFGGHFGMDGETPWFLFPKGKYLVGVAGLPQDEADRVARVFAGLVRAD